MQIIKTTEKNEIIIKDVHDSKLVGYNIFLMIKKITKKTTWKNIKTDTKNISKIAQYAQLGNTTVPAKKNYINFCSYRKYFFKKPIFDFVIGLPES